MFKLPAVSQSEKGVSRRLAYFPALSMPQGFLWTSLFSTWSGGHSACCHKWQPQSPQPYLSVTSRLPRPKMCVGCLRLSSKHGDTPPSSTSVIETQQLWGASQHALNLQAVCHYLHSGVTDCHLATNCICVLSRCLAIPYKVRGGHVRGVSCQLSTECHGGNAGSRPSIHNGRTLVTLCHHHLVDAPGLGPLSSSSL